jgi:methyl-accepting chemotaxis protein
LAENIVLQRAGKKKEALDAVAAGKGKKTMDSIRAQVDEMNHEESNLLEQRAQEANTAQILSILFVAGGTFVAFATSLYIFSFIRRNVISQFMLPVNEAIVAISSSTKEILVTMEEHERTASQQSAAANETSATVTELSASSRQSAEQAANAAAVAEKASAATVQGGEVIHQAVVAMGNLKDKITVMSDQILRLGEQTGQIGSIATLVKDISAEINMLALNAAVEAARAGEHGKGFAVVASEVRKLADQSKKSAEQATVLVAEIQKSTHSSIMMTEEGARTVAEVMQLAQKVAELFNNLSGMAGSVNENAQQVMLNAKQQSAAFTQVVEATNSIASGAKETAAGISQTKIGVQKLNEAAVSLKAIA